MDSLFSQCFIASSSSSSSGSGVREELNDSFPRLVIDEKLTSPSLPPLIPLPSPVESIFAQPPAVMTSHTSKHDAEPSADVVKTFYGIMDGYGTCRSEQVTSSQMTPRSTSTPIPDDDVIIVGNTISKVRVVCF